MRATDSLYQRKYAIGSLVLFWLFLSFLTSCSQESNANQTSLEDDVPDEDGPIDVATTEADIYYPKSGPRMGTVVNGEKTKHITLLPRIDVYETTKHFQIPRWKNNSKFMIGWGIRNYPEPTKIYITKLINEGGVAGVFALEKHVPTNQICTSSPAPASRCSPLKIYVAKEGYVVFHTVDGLASSRSHYTYDFKSEKLQVSFTNASTGLKTYQDIAIHPPETNCETTKNISRYNCLYQKESRVKNAPKIVTTGAHSSSLPDNMIYNKSNYHLILNEEFSGTGMASLDNRIWNYPKNPNTDANGVPCQNVGDGYYYYTKVYKCGSALNTIGKFTFKYGYVEMEYKVNMKRNHSYINMSSTIGYSGEARSHAIQGYPSIRIDSVTKLLKYIGSEFDFLEYIPNQTGHYQHVYVRRVTGVSSKIKEYSSTTHLQFCQSWNVDNLKIYYLPACSGHSYSRADKEFTITRAFEWTPSGYRQYIRVHDVHAKLQLIPHRSIALRIEGRSGSVFPQTILYIWALVVFLLCRWGLCIYRHRLI